VGKQRIPPGEGSNAGDQDEIKTRPLDRVGFQAEARKRGRGAFCGAMERPSQHFDAAEPKDRRLHTVFSQSPHCALYLSLALFLSFTFSSIPKSLHSKQTSFVEHFDFFLVFIIICLVVFGDQVDSQCHMICLEDKNDFVPHLDPFPFKRLFFFFF
jgi:hypothetical protein